MAGHPFQIDHGVSLFLEFTQQQRLAASRIPVDHGQFRRKVQILQRADDPLAISPVSASQPVGVNIHEAEQRGRRSAPHAPAPAEYRFTPGNFRKLPDEIRQLGRNDFKPALFSGIHTYLFV
ncbi:hypothetical protein D3C76_1214290 [compost metagenome]